MCGSTAGRRSRYLRFNFFFCRQGEDSRRYVATERGSVAAAILAAVEGGILPPGKNARLFGDLQIAGRFGVCVDLFRRAACPAYTSGETPAATPLNTYGDVSSDRKSVV